MRGVGEEEASYEVTEGFEEHEGGKKEGQWREYGRGKEEKGGAKQAKERGEE